MQCLQRPPPPDWQHAGTQAWFSQAAPAALRAALVALTDQPDPFAVAETLQTGRNRVYRLELAATPVVVKCCPEPGWPGRLRAARIGTKAYRAYAAAVYLQQNGVGTPAPLACVAFSRRGLPGASWLICADAGRRQSFKQALIAQFRHDPECEKLLALIEPVALALRRMHDRGFAHRDPGNQNLLLPRFDPRHPVPAMPPESVLMLDLNRARWGAPLRLAQRARDLSRIYLPSDLRRVFLLMYWGTEELPPQALLRAERRCRRRFAWHSATRAWRHPLRKRHRNADSSEADPQECDLWIWDSRSVQAIPALRSRDRRRFRRPGLLAGRFVKALWLFGPRLMRHWRTLGRTPFPPSTTCPRNRIRIALTAAPDTLSREIDLLHELDAQSVLLRFYHHAQPDARAWSLNAFDQLHAAGFRVAGALVQDRTAILDPNTWRTFCLEVLHHVRGRIEWLEYGHAVNRVKWGLWHLGEYDRFLETAAELKRVAPDVDLVGPAVIDFEFLFLLAALGRRPRAIQWDALSLHLYVDRRGAPENRQGRFDATAKFRLARAIDAAAHASRPPRVLVSEFNWPLKDTGVWSPVGSPYVTPGPRFNDPSVDETEYANYLIRYLLLALCSGHVDECVIWRLAAHGFGLVDDHPAHAWRPRPAFTALKHLLRQLRDTRFVGALTDCRAPGPFILKFALPDGRPLCVAWQHPGTGTFDCPFAPKAVTNVFGHPESADSPIRIDSLPRFILG